MSEQDGSKKDGMKEEGLKREVLKREVLKREVLKREVLKREVLKREVEKTTKGERTRALILSTSLEMFMEKGFEGTTMRAIAKEAGVSLGNAYYYFESKEHLIQAFYARMHDDHLQACSQILGGSTDLAERLSLVMKARVDTMMPYHRFAGVLFRSAADPRSPLNPFSETSKPVRDESIALFGQVVAGSSARVRQPLAKELPELLWLYQMGVVLFWIFDRSENHRRTYRLAERTAELVARLVGLANLPPFRPVLRAALGLLAELKDEEETRLGEDSKPFR